MSSSDPGQAPVARLAAVTLVSAHAGPAPTLAGLVALLRNGSEPVAATLRGAAGPARAASRGDAVPATTVPGFLTIFLFFD